MVDEEGRVALLIDHHCHQITRVLEPAGQAHQGIEAVAQHS